MTSPRRIALPAMIALTVAVGCAGPNAEKAKTEVGPVTLKTVRPEFDYVREYEEFTGRTEARNTVDIRTRVTGYLLKAPFTEGMDVEEGQTLFEIDPEPYKAEVDRYTALLDQGTATSDRLATEYQRARALVSSRAVSQEEIDRILGGRNEAVATVAAAKAALRTAKLNLGYTKVTAPFKGRVSRRSLGADPGNLVKADDTILTTLVQLDPIQAYFDIDERTVLKLRRLIGEGKLKSARAEKIQVKLSLADEEDFRRDGVIDFVDNHLDPNTGTLRIRVLIENKEKLLSPGMFMRLRLPTSLPENLPLLPDEVLANDQGQKGVYVVNPKTKKVEYVHVETGQRHNDKRVIKSARQPDKDPAKDPKDRRSVPRKLTPDDEIVRYPLAGQTAERSDKAVKTAVEGGTTPNGKGGDRVPPPNDKAAADKRRAALPSL